MPLIEQISGLTLLPPAISATCHHNSQKCLEMTSCCNRSPYFILFSAILVPTLKDQNVLLAVLGQILKKLVFK